MARYHGAGEAGKTVQDYHCCVRGRLGEIGPENADLWWLLSPTNALQQEIRDRLAHHALPFLAKFASRDPILREWAAVEDNQFAGSPPRIVKAIILVERGLAEEARTLLAAQAHETQNPGHPAYVRALARRLGVDGLEPIDGGFGLRPV